MKTVAGQVCVSKSRGAIIADNTWSCVWQIAEFKLTPEHAEQQWETLLTESELQELSSLLIHCRWSGKLPEVRSVFIIHFFWLQQRFPEVITANKKDSYSVSDKCKNCEIMTIDLLMFSLLSTWCFSLSLSQSVLQI